MRVVLKTRLTTVSTTYHSLTEATTLANVTMPNNCYQIASAVLNTQYLVWEKNWSSSSLVFVFRKQYNRNKNY